MTHVLVPVAVLDGQTVSPGLIDALDSVTVTVLGYHEVPEQTPPDQARNQFEDRASEILEDICDEFEAGGGTAYYRLVFTHDRAKSVDRVATEIEADATLIVQPTPQVEEVYVAVGARDEVPLVASVLGDFLSDIEADVFLRFFLGAEKSDATAGEEALEELASQLTETGVDRDRIDTAVQPGKKAVGPIVQDAEGRGVDLVVLSEPALSIGEFLLGDIEERISKQLLAPVLVVRKEKAHASEPASDEN